MSLLRSAKFEGVACLAGEVDPDGLGVCILAHALQAVLAAHAAHLVATEGCIERQSAVRVDPDGPRTQSVRHAMGPPDIARPDAGGQAVARLVRLPDDLFLGLEWDHGEYQAENLFLGYAHLVVNPREDGRLNEKAMHQFRVGGNLASSDQLSALRLGNVNVTLDLFLLAFEGRRTHLCLYLQRVAQLDSTRTLGKAVDDFIMHLRFDKEPRAGDAGLATGGENSCNHPVDDPLIRVGEDDIGRLPTQLEAHTGQVIGGILHHMDAGRSRPGESHLVYPWMAHEWPTRARAIARDDVEDAGGESRLGEEPGELKRRRRGVFGGLDHKGAACGERRGELEAEQQKRGVPGSDGSDHADRLAPCVDEKVRLVTGNCFSLKFVRRAREVVVPFGQRLELSSHLANELAVVRTFYSGQPFRVLIQQRGQPSHQPGPLGAGHATPRPFVEGGAGRANSSIHVGFTSFGCNRPDLPRVRIDTLKSAARLSVYPFASNKHLVVAYFSGHRCLNHLHMHLLVDSSTPSSTSGRGLCCKRDDR